MSLKEKIEASLTDRRRTGLRIAGMAAVLLITLWMSVSVVSYIFTWRQDQSLPAGMWRLMPHLPAGFPWESFW